MNIIKKRLASVYTGAYLRGKSTNPRAARVNVAVAAFKDRFVNGRWTWTRYFCAAILENTKLFIVKRVLRPCRNKVCNDAYVRECSSRASPYALLGVSIGAREAMISFRKIYEIENVLQKARTNPKAA